MVETTNKTPGQKDVNQPLGYTFGGFSIDMTEPGEKLAQAPETSFSGVSLVDDKPNPGLTSLVGSVQPTQLTDEELARKVDKFSFALGKDFSRDDIHRYLSTGNEDQLRHYAAAVKDTKDEQARKVTLTDILSGGLPDDPSQQSIMYSNVKALGKFKPANNPMTVVEEAYAKRFVESVPDVGPKDSAINRLISGISEKVVDEESRKRVSEAQDSVLTTMEKAERLKLYQENAKDILEKAETRYAQESLFGKVIDFGKSAVPFYDYYNMVMDVPGMEAAGVLPGTTIAQWVTKLYDQTPAVQKEWLEKAVTTIGAYNPQLAVRVAEAAVSYSTTDEAMDNFFGVLDVKDVPGLGAAAVGTAVFSSKLALMTLDHLEARRAFQQAVRAGASPNATAPGFNAAMGNINGAAVHNVATAAPGASPSPQQMAAATPTYVNPMAAPGATTGLAGAQTGRFASFVAQRAGQLQAKVEALIRVNRLPEEALQAGFAGMKIEFENTINQSFNNAIQNASRLPGNVQRPVGPVAPVNLTVGGRTVRPEKTKENLGRWEFEATKPNGQLFSSAHNMAEMHTWARLMGLQRGDYGAKQVGNGWVMTLSRPLDETRPYVRDALITTKNKTNPVTPLIGGLKRGGGRVSEFSANNRIAYVSGQEKLRETIEPLVSDLLSLKEPHVDALNRVMTEEMNRIDPATNLPGYFFADHREFSDAYRRLNGRSPTRKETNAYISARILNDLEYGMRYSSYYKELARLGIKKIELKTKVIDQKTGQPVFGKSVFEGKVIDRIPVEAQDAKARAMVVLYHEGDVDPKIVPLHALMTEKGQGHLEELKAQGYKFIQTANPVRKPGKEVFGEDESVNFIITKDFHQRELGTDLIPYREGWHQIYPYKFYVKQPVVRRIDRTDAATGRTFTHHLYEGETTLMGVHTQAEAKKYAEAMEIARQIAFEGRAGNLDQHLAENLPLTRSEFMRRFNPGPNGEPPAFSKTEPFFAFGDGQGSMDAFKTHMEGRYANLYDAIRSPWNLMNQVDKKFVGHRDEILHTVKEGRGTQGNPVFNLVRAERLDPLSAMSDGISNMIRNHHMIDLRLQMGESWIKEFGHMLDGDKQTLYNDMVNTILDPPYLKNIENVNYPDWVRAEHARQAFLELMNLETPGQSALENLRSSLLDQIYERLGQETSNEWATSRIMTTRHPLSFFRGIVYHMKVGMFNPLVAIQNAAQMANILAISPLHGTAGFTYGLFAHLTRLNAHPNIVNALGELAEKATGGKYKKQWFQEGLTAMKDSGYFSIGGGHALGDYLNEPKFIRKETGKILDGSSILFKESEKLLRTSAFMTAFLEHRIASNGRALTSIDLNEILGRANLYAGRMSRDEKARWQSGELMSTITQFWSYPARLMEMIWEKGHGRKDALTGMEKVRLVAMNSMLYGLPIGGLGTAVGGVVNAYDHFKKEAVDRGINVDDGALGLLFNGVAGQMSKHYLGVNVSPAIGPTGRDLTQNLDTDLGWFKFITGPSGAVTLDFYNSTKPFQRGFWMAINGDIQPKAIASDLMDIARNVSGIDKAAKMYLALQHHKVYTKIGQEIDEVEAWPGVISAITGQLPNEIDHAMWEKKILDDLPLIKGQLARQAQHDVRLLLQASSEGDRDLEAHYAKRIDLYLSGLPLSERQEVVYKALEGNKRLIDTINQKWSHYRPEASEEFKKAYGKYFNLPTTSE